MFTEINAKTIMAIITILKVMSILLVLISIIGFDLKAVTFSELKTK